MPFYDYQCKACQHHFEAMQRISDPVLTTCPQCYQKELVKLIASPAFQLKGEGWYVTDFKNKKEAKPQDKDKKTEPGEGAVKTQATSSNTSEKT